MQDASKAYRSVSRVAADLGFAGYRRGVEETFAGCACDQSGRLIVTERVFQFRNAGDAAEWFTNAVNAIEPMVGSAVTERTRVRSDGGAYVALTKRIDHGYHVAYGEALDGDMTVSIIVGSTTTLAADDIAHQLAQADDGASIGLTQLVPPAFPTQLG